MSIFQNNSKLWWQTSLIIIIAACTISMLGFGIRSVLGLFLDPMTVANGWTRETYALAMAIQNLLWGIGLPIAGIWVDKSGPRKVLLLGAVIYATGIYGMANASSASSLQLMGGVVAGTGIAFTAFSLMLATMVKVVGDEKRSFVLGLGTAAGSVGQVVFSPISQGMITQYGWHSALTILASLCLLIIPLALLLPKIETTKAFVKTEQTLTEALYEALSHRGFVLLTIGFFVCGFHVAFITVHFPAYIKDMGLDPIVGAYCIAIVGLFNIVGSLYSGFFGQRYSKKMGLAGIYFARAITITAMLLLPKTASMMYLFSAVMGLLWLSTVPLTTGIVAQVFGVRYMATLFGLVFLSHQLGSFMGVWLGGKLYDQTGNYDMMWYAGIILGVVAALLHLPINENPLKRLQLGN